jgi:hypothetical protein
MPSRDLLRVLGCAAASSLSVHHACCPLARAPSGPTVLGTLASQCRDLAALEDPRNALLATRMPTGLSKRRRQVAMAVVALPDHGSVADAHHDAVCRRKAKSGTPHFFPEATASAVVQGRRYTLAMCRVRAKQTMDQVRRPLLARLVTVGSRITRLRLARGFYSVRGRRELITPQGPCSRPAGKRGTKPPTPGGPTGTSALAAETHSRWPSYTVKSPQAGHVACDLAGVCRNPRGQRGRHQRETLL